LFRKEAARRVREIADRASKYAAEQGLTPKKLNERLHEDNDEYPPFRSIPILSAAAFLKSDFVTT
jgi:hypothetical protein